MNEKEIIRCLKDRDERGAEELLKHYGPLIRYIITPILSDIRDQEECVSEIAMRVWEKIETYDSDRGSWNSWLTAISRNTALNRLRNKKSDRSYEDVSYTIPSSEPTPEELALRREWQDTLREAIERLSPSEKVLFYRKYYYMQPVAQIASELGLTERAVEGRLYRIKKRLRGMLGGEVYE